MSLSILLQRFIPMGLLTRCAGYLAQCRNPVVAQSLIRVFMLRHGLDLHEASRGNVGDYRSFNDFFTRSLLPGVRPIAAADWVSPVDGRVSQAGRIEAGRMIQAKRQAYSASELLADAGLARQLEGGRFTTVYLSPRDYHRVHMPCEGRLLGMRHVPGRLLSVRPDIVQGLDGLLARNERLICWFEHPRYGVFAMVLVGAAIVGSIATVWHGLVAPPRVKVIREWHYAGGDSTASRPVLAQAEKMGHFQLGSTVVVMMPQSTLAFHPEWRIGQTVRLGQAIASAGSSVS